MLHRICTLAVIALLGACPAPDENTPTGDTPDGTTTDGAVGDNGPSDVPIFQDIGADAPSIVVMQSIYDKMRPTCVGCHSGAWDKGFFDSFDAFTNLLVYATDGDGEPRYVVPGDSENSVLVDLLEGDAAGNYPQMPLDRPFTEYEADGETFVTTQEVRDWIDGMDGGAPPVVDTAPTDEQLVRRVRADQLQALLYDGLGLDDSDFWSMATNYGYYEVVGNGQNANLPMRDPAATPDHTVNSNFRASATERWFAVGGPDYGNGRTRSQELSPAFMQTITQVSQAWCRVAITKSGNDAVLKHATLSDNSTDNATAIRDNLQYLHLRLLGEPPTDDETTEMFTDVFQVYEALSNAEAAWTAVCSTLVRDPRFLTY